TGRAGPAVLVTALARTAPSPGRRLVDRPLRTPSTPAPALADPGPGPADRTGILARGPGRPGTGLGQSGAKSGNPGALVGRGPSGTGWHRRYFHRLAPGRRRRTAAAGPTAGG